MARKDDDDDVDLTQSTLRRDVDDEDLIVSGGVPRPLVITGIAAATVAVVVLAVAKRADHHVAMSAPPSAPATMGPAEPATPDRSPLALGRSADVAIANGGTLFVLGQQRLARLPRGRSRPDRVTYAVSPAAMFLAVDSAARRVWVADPYAGSVVTYDAASLARIGQAQPLRYFEISAIAALDGRLFLAMKSGVYELAAPNSATRRVPGFSRAVQAITADPTRHRLLAVSADHSLLEIRAGRVRVATPPSTAVLIDSALVTDHGIWAVGIGTTAGGTRIARVDPDTLRVVPLGSGDLDAPQGARGWPGGSVFWVQDAYSGTVTCYDARLATRTASFRDLTATIDSADVKVVSRPGAAYAINQEQVVRLRTTPACPG